MSRGAPKGDLIEGRAAFWRPLAPCPPAPGKLHHKGFPVAQTVKNLLQCRRPGFHPWVGKIPWRREWQPSLIFSPGKYHRQRNLMGYSPWGCRESDTTERLTLSRGTNTGSLPATLTQPESSRCRSAPWPCLRPSQETTSQAHPARTTSSSSTSLPSPSGTHFHLSAEGLP